jgi:regulator of sirC expression with transglutaminase-like and TPR domain
LFVTLRYAVISADLVHSFSSAALSRDQNLATAALLIARIEYPKLDAVPYLAQLDALGREAGRRVAAALVVPGDAPPRADPSRYAQVMAINDYLFNELHFVGNELQYEDPRNSFLNEVMERRTGIPITLALLYIEVARRAGLHVEGLNFPGHFLLRCPPRRGQAYSEGLIIDPFHGGAILSADACRELLRLNAGDEAVFDSHLQGHATKSQILSRMLLNLKRIYVRMHSFPQARDVTDLLLALAPFTLNELRDRGLLAYQLKDFSAALRDLQQYLQLAPKVPLDENERDEHEKIWEHVKTLRRHVASLN